MNNLSIGIFLFGCALAATAEIVPRLFKKKPKSNHRRLADEIRRRAEMLANSLEDESVRLGNSLEEINAIREDVLGTRRIFINLPRNSDKRPAFALIDYSRYLAPLRRMIKATRSISE